MGRGGELTETNLEQSKRRLSDVERKLRQDDELSRGYEEIARKQLESGIIEHAAEEPTGNRVLHATQTSGEK